MRGLPEMGALFFCWERGQGEEMVGRFGLLRGGWMERGDLIENENENEENEENEEEEEEEEEEG
ncbi:MAG: hypothetical protein ACYC67_23865 [Prosthecobacter sp.]